MPLTVSLVAPFPPPYGGMSVLSETIMKSLVKRDLNVIPIDTHKNFKTRSNLLNGIFRFISYILQLRKVAKSDVVLLISSSGIFFYLIAIPSLLVARILKRPILLDFVGGGIIDKLQNPKSRMKYAFKLFDFIVVPTQTFKKIFQLHGINCAVFPHIVDIDRFNRFPLKKNYPVLFAAKSLTDYSGIDTLIDAFGIVKNRYPLAKFIIAGEGKKRSELENYVRKISLEGVEFKGNVSYDEMPSLFDNSTIFVHGTKFESFGIVLVEAMASGTPIVSTNVGGIPDVLTDGKEAFLVDYGDSVAMGKKIIELHENEEIYNNFRNSGIKKAFQYGEESLAPRLISLLTQLTK